MAGYIMTFNSIESLLETASTGIYATKIKIPTNGLWNGANESTLADYSTMKAGDNIYLFHKRKIYGVGELVNLGDDCKFLNFPEANIPKPTKLKELNNSPLIADSEWGDDNKELRWLCTFKHEPHFFSEGIDMDAALMSNPSAFKMLRAFERLSFIKVDDVENEALKSLFIKKFENQINNNNPNNSIESKIRHSHKEIKDKIIRGNYNFNIRDITENSKTKENLYRRETTLELSLLYQLSNMDPQTIEVFGEWDYLSHQVIASPFKPIVWVDKMDVFGYKYVKNFKPTISKYLVTELKREEATKSDVDQLLKYVDWVNNEYSYGDYSMINAFLVASEFNDEVINHLNEVGERIYTTNLRDDRSSERWSNIKLVRYHYDSYVKKTIFEIVEK